MFSAVNVQLYPGILLSLGLKKKPVKSEVNELARLYSCTLLQQKLIQLICKCLYVA